MTETPRPYFENSLQHLLAELERIDLLIADQVARARKLYSQDEQFRGLYISEEEVDALLKRPVGRPRWASDETPIQGLIAKLDKINQHIGQRKQESLRRSIELRLHHLQQLFGLDPFEVDVVLVCLAVELDLRYERLYAYLQDDVTKKQPSVNLVLNLLASSTEAKFEAFRHFAADAHLVDNQLIDLISDSSQPQSPLLAKFLKVDSRIAQYLLGYDEMDKRIRSFAVMRDPQNRFDAMLVDDSVKDRLAQFLDRSSTADGAIVYLRGPYGVGRQSTAEAICRTKGIRILVADFEWLTGEQNEACVQAFGLVQREAKLQQAAVYWKYFDTVLNGPNQSLFKGFIRSLADRPALTFLAGEAPWQPVETLRAAPFAQFKLPRPSFAVRSRMWLETLNDRNSLDADIDFAALATKFNFTGGQILDAAATARNLARQGDSQNCRISTADLYEACRFRSNQMLATLARKIVPKYKWKDIVLPDDRLEQLREICNHVKYRDRVYGEWGFDRKLSLGKGLSVLFAGPSGTGKTMAAEIIAGALGLELYKIDLSTVVSKYIGETEKNLSQIFTEAETSNAILFFDEADALFGKRSEVKDSHDRYANIETGYLLQRMEEYQGVVILASNLRKNMDEAFVRRLHFTIEFPFPNESDRYRIWQGIWPPETPRGRDLDLALMARSFELSGGNIRNIVLAAAFLAADNGSSVDMKQMLRATRREYQKMGKVITEEIFHDFEPSDLKGEMSRDEAI